MEQIFLVKQSIFFETCVLLDSLLAAALQEEENNGLKNKDMIMGCTENDTRIARDLQMQVEKELEVKEFKKLQV